MLLTNSVCWAKFERASLGEYKIATLSWMFREAKVAWHYLLLASMKLVLERHGITEGVLVLDESDLSRSKRTKRIHKAHKQKHKASLCFLHARFKGNFFSHQNSLAVEGNVSAVAITLKEYVTQLWSA